MQFPVIMFLFANFDIMIYQLGTPQRSNFQQAKKRLSVNPSMGMSPPLSFEPSGTGCPQKKVVKKTGTVRVGVAKKALKPWNTGRVLARPAPQKVEPCKTLLNWR